jgi:hypothetical protein
MLDREKQREYILFTIKHHGTRTQGEDYRLEQVADCIMEIIDAILETQSAIKTVSGTEHGSRPYFHIR